MLASWTEEGLPPDLFWRVTPRVFTAIMKGRFQARIRFMKDQVSLAWHIERLARSGRRMRPLEVELRAIGKRELPEQSGEDMVDILRSIDNGQGLMNFKFVPHPE